MFFRRKVVAPLATNKNYTYFFLCIISKIIPDVLIKGGDYSIDEIVGSDIVQKNGGRVETIPLVEGKSTTSLIERMSNNKAD